MNMKAMALIVIWRRRLAAGALLLGLLLPACVFAAEQGSFLVVSDIHFNPMADDAIAGKLAVPRQDAGVHGANVRRAFPRGAGH